jgi:hypothetical protein
MATHAIFVCWYLLDLWQGDVRVRSRIAYLVKIIPRIQDTHFSHTYENRESQGSNTCKWTQKKATFVSRQSLWVILDLKWRINCDKCISEYLHLKANDSSSRVLSWKVSNKKELLQIHTLYNPYIVHEENDRTIDHGQSCSKERFAACGIHKALSE